VDPDEEHETKQTPVGPDRENLKTTYGELCNSYRDIDEFRAKLLGFLPLATGTGILLLFNFIQPNKTQLNETLLNQTIQNQTLPNETKMYLLAIGIFGCIITLGLFAYEIYGIQKCHCIIETGKSMEKGMCISGQFRNRPRAVRLPIVGEFINEPLASGIIYPAVLASWTFVALYFLYPQKAGIIAVLVFLVFFLLSVNFNNKLGSRGAKICEDPAMAWINKGIILGSQSKLNEAIKAFNEAIKIDPKLAIAWYSKGNALMLLGRTSEANAAFAKAKELGLAYSSSG
jgi:tetratricopeptide (TPR) repeat protein